MASVRRCSEVVASLPWLANETLSDAERSRVEGHLAECEACRREAERCRLVPAVGRAHVLAENRAHLLRRAGKQHTETVCHTAFSDGNRFGGKLSPGHGGHEVDNRARRVHRISHEPLRCNR